MNVSGLRHRWMREREEIRFMTRYYSFNFNGKFSWIMKKTKSTHRPRELTIDDRCFSATMRWMRYTDCAFFCFFFAAPDDPTADDFDFFSYLRGAFKKFVKWNFIVKISLFLRSFAEKCKIKSWSIHLAWWIYDVVGKYKSEGNIYLNYENKFHLFHRGIARCSFMKIRSCSGTSQ